MFRKKKERHPYWTKITLVCFAIMIFAVLIVRVGYRFRPEATVFTNTAAPINDDESFDALLQQVLKNTGDNNPTTTQEISQAALHSEEVNFLNDDGDVVHTFLSKPVGPGPFPALILLHGNESSLRATERASMLLGEKLSESLQAVVLSLDWRDIGFGSSGNDARSSIKYLRETSEVQQQPIVVVGLDYGAYLSLAQLSALDVQGVIAAYGFFNPASHYQFLQEKDPAAATRFLAQTGCNLAVQLTQCLGDLSLLSSIPKTVPFLALHNTKDALVSVAESQALVNAANINDATRAKLVTFDGAESDHDFLEDTSSALFIPALAAMKSWMTEIIVSMNAENSPQENQ